MARHDRSARAGSDRTSLYDDITNKIIAELEEGRPGARRRPQGRRRCLALGQDNLRARPHFARGRTASIRANRLITGRTRLCTVKALVMRNRGERGPLARHLNYLRRDGVTRDGERAKMFGPETDDADAKEFTERCKDDRHHFRFIVSPEDAADMEDLKRFTRELMAQAEKDLGTRLDWVAVDHWNTDNPHVHVIVRGRTDDGQDLVIDRDYIKSGMRDRAQDLVTLELGPRTDLNISRALDRQIEAERWTQLDRQLVRDRNEHDVMDVAPLPDRQPDDYLIQKVGRLRHLERLGLAEAIGPGQWIITDEAEATLRELGQRGDIIKRMHRALSEQGIGRGVADYVLAGETHGLPVIGRLVERGLDDELRGTAYAVVDGIDGRTHHIKLSDIEAAGDGAPGSIVELRSFEDAKGERRVALAVRSDLSIAAQTTADGATWLDRQLIARDPGDLGGGFGLEVKQAMEARTEHLIEEGLARREGQRIVFARNLLATLRQRELDALGQKLTAEMNMPFQQAAAGEYVAGTYRQRFAFSSGRFAMIEAPGPDGGLGFKLVPWTPSIERHIGQHISGITRGDGGVNWSFGCKRGLGL
ncbi:type VI secretion protein [Mesorhizobium sp. L-8-3]|nr:type VI secretion protein [Mesorhizobium sp. L-8-3]